MERLNDVLAQLDVLIRYGSDELWIDATARIPSQLCGALVRDWYHFGVFFLDGA
jgi:hypothetical protein